MDIVLEVADRNFFTPFVYPTSWPEESWTRQLLSLCVVVNVGGVLLYMAMASFSYFVLFDHRLMQHPLFLPNQVRREIKTSLQASPGMSLATALLFLLEVHGYSRLHVAWTGSGWTMLLVTARDVVAFLSFTDMCIYWIHRTLHHRLLYKHLHKMHHTWKVPTPFASHAFHPLDGFLQSVPYHVYPFLFPLNKYVYLALFVIVNVWTVSIHDGQYRVPERLKYFINGSAHHTDHHLYFDYNFGQYFTLWDRLGSSFKEPSALEGRSLVDEAVGGAKVE